MNNDRLAFLLDVIPPEELIIFFSSNKTQISCIDDPITFLNQLRDYDLVPEELYRVRQQDTCMPRAFILTLEISKWIALI